MSIRETARYREILRGICEQQRESPTYQASLRRARVAALEPEGLILHAPRGSFVSQALFLSIPCSCFAGGIYSPADIQHCEADSDGPWTRIRVTVVDPIRENRWRDYHLELFAMEADDLVFHCFYFAGWIEYSQRQEIAGNLHRVGRADCQTPAACVCRLRQALQLVYEEGWENGQLTSAIAASTADRECDQAAEASAAALDEAVHPVGREIQPGDYESSRQAPLGAAAALTAAEDAVALRPWVAQVQQMIRPSRRTQQVRQEPLTREEENRLNVELVGLTVQRVGNSPYLRPYWFIGAWPGERVPGELRGRHWWDEAAAYRALRDWRQRQLLATHYGRALRPAPEPTPHPAPGRGFGQVPLETALQIMQQNAGQHAAEPAEEEQSLGAESLARQGGYELEPTEYEDTGGTPAPGRISRDEDGGLAFRPDEEQRMTVADGLGLPEGHGIRVLLEDAFHEINRVLEEETGGLITVEENAGIRRGFRQWLRNICDYVRRNRQAEAEHRPPPAPPNMQSVANQLQAVIRHDFRPLGGPDLRETTRERMRRSTVRQLHRDAVQRRLAAGDHPLSIPHTPADDPEIADIEQGLRQRRERRLQLQATHPPATAARPASFTEEPAAPPSALPALRRLRIRKQEEPDGDAAGRDESAAMDATEDPAPPEGG